jgi:hypothetical protein
VDKARNDLSAAVPKFCLALEEHRRTPEGRVRTSQELLASFFPHDEKVCTDRIFRYLPQEVRGPIIAAWGIRGIKAALRDSDEKIQTVVHDALVAGDLDHTAFEDGLAPETLVRWVPLADLWAFWRGGKLSKQAIHKALSTAYELYLFDARWFLDTINAKGGSIKGTDVLADGLTKDDLTQWIRRIHETGDGTPKGMVAALGWDKIVSKTANDVLVSVLDAMVTKVGLVVAAKESSPKLPDDLLAKLDEKVGAAEPAKGDGGKAEGDLHPPIIIHTPTEKPPVEDTGWSLPPTPTDPGATQSNPAQGGPPPSEEGINVVVDDELIIGDRNAPPTSPRIQAASPVASFYDDATEIKSMPSRRPEPNKPPPPFRRTR